MESIGYLENKFWEDTKCGNICSKENPIFGTQWKVELFDDYVLKTPRNGAVNTATELYNRHLKAIGIMEDGYYRSKGVKPPVPEMALVGNGVIQQRVTGRRLADFTDEEIMGFPESILVDLCHLLDCSLIANQDGSGIRDFVDLPGYNLNLPWPQRSIRALNPRYSINIMVDEQKGELFFVDPDMYFASTRNIGTKLAAASMKPMMMLFTEMFRDRIRKVLGERILE